MFFLQFFQGIYTFFIDEPQYAFGRLLLVAIGILLIWLAYKHVLEPLIMLPLGIGMIAVNAGLMILEVSTASGGVITTGLRETSHGLVGNLFINTPLSNVDELTAFLQVDLLQPI
jgi:Na+-transporting methylmalonyl-CoA/oxaloacetate decarboxylase beta subunit